MGNEKSKQTPRAFETIPELYKFLLEETFKINCQLCEEFLSRFNVGLIMSIHRLANTLYERNISVEEIQEMNKCFEMVMKQHKKRVFQFTHEKNEGRYKRFPKNMIKNVLLKEHKMYKIASEISEFASDFGTEEHKFNVFLCGKIEHIKNKLKEQIEISMESLLPGVLYEKSLCSEALCIDGGEGTLMRCKVCPVEADFFPGNPYTVKPVNRDSLQFKESQLYVWIELGKLFLSKSPSVDMKNVHPFIVHTLDLNGNVLVELEGIIEFCCTKEAKLTTKKDGRSAQIFLWPINKIVQTKESKTFKTRVKVEIEMTTSLLRMKPNKTITITCSDVEHFNKLHQEVQSLELSQSMFSQNEEESKTSTRSTASSFNRNLTIRDSQNNRNNENRNEDNADGGPRVQSEFPEDLPKCGPEFHDKFDKKMIASFATKVWDDFGEIIAITASKKAGKVLQRLLIPVGIAWWSYNIWHFVKDFREKKITGRELIRSIGRYVIADIGTAGLAFLISMLVAGPAGFFVGIGLAAILTPLDFFVGDRIARFFLPRGPKEEMAWRAEQLRKRKQSLLKQAFKILKIEANAANWEIDRAYRTAALKYHPDQGHTAEDVDNKFDAINKAYNLIKQERSLEDRECEAGNNTVRPIQAITEG